MPIITLETLIDAPAEICFDLMRDIRIHPESTAKAQKRVSAVAAEGLIGLGQTVTFSGKHLGFRHRLTVKVVEFERPRLFVDKMTTGTFSSFQHVHEFFPHGTQTLMRDTLEWIMPFGIVGRIADKLLIAPHLKQLVAARNAKLKQLAESEAGCATENSSFSSTP